LSLFPRREDYARKNKKTTSRKYMKKQRLPTQLKSKPLYCRNCLKQYESYTLGKPCKFCGKTAPPLKSRR